MLKKIEEEEDASSPDVIAEAVEESEPEIEKQEPVKTGLMARM